MMISINGEVQPINTASKIYTSYHKNGNSGNIWISGQFPAISKAFLHQYNISKVVCLIDDKENKEFSGIDYLKIAMEDNPTYNIRQHFRRIYKFIRNGIKYGDNILIHCKSGASRSGAIVIMYLMSRGYSIIDAYTILKRKRPCIKPIAGFVKQLIVWKYGKRKLNKILLKYNECCHQECSKVISPLKIITIWDDKCDLNTN